jgi:hypothetical protein
VWFDIGDLLCISAGFGENRQLLGRKFSGFPIYILYSASY